MEAIAPSSSVERRIVCFVDNSNAAIEVCRLPWAIVLGSVKGTNLMTLMPDSDKDYSEVQYWRHVKIANQRSAQNSAIVITTLEASTADRTN